MKPEIDLERLVVHILGRQPAIRYQISTLCRYGWPAVLRNDPYSTSNEPNPNIYYLVCPYLRRAISRLEDDGLITRLELRVKEDRSLTDDLLLAQGAHRREWNESAARMDPDGVNLIAPPNIAATADDGLLKCLHAHYAWYLGHPEYELGRLIEAELERTWCEDETCRELATRLADKENRE